jgi:hypothetical protein
MNKGICKVSKQHERNSRKFRATQTKSLLRNECFIDVSSTPINDTDEETTAKLCNIPFCALFIVFDRSNLISKEKSSFNIHNHDFAKQKRYFIIQFAQFMIEIS